MIDYRYVRPQKAKNLRERYETVRKCENPLSSTSYKDAVILPCRLENFLFGAGGMVDCDGNYIKESALVGRVDRGYSFSKEEYRDEKVVYCGYLVNHWGHFLVEAVARLWYFLNNDKSIEKYVFFVAENEEREIKGNYKEFFELLGIWDMLEIINRPTRYREVIIPQLSDDKELKFFSSEYKALFDRVADSIKVDPQWETYSKVFLTRSQLKNASLSDIGNDMIDSFFANNGYTIVAPEKMGLSQLIYVLRNAKEVAAISGSLALNLMFSRDRQKLVMVERLVINNNYTVLTNSARDLEVVHIDSYLSIYSTDLGSGPYLLFYKGLLEQYSKDNNMVPPDARFLSRRYEIKCFKQYMKIYKRAYGYSWFMYNWAEKYIGAYREAYEDALLYYRDYLYGLRPFKKSQYLEKRYIKQFIKRVLTRSNLT